MKDYSFRENKEFIRDYSIKDNKIIINLANKKKKILPYDRNIEITILKTMRNQVLRMGYEQEISSCLKYSKINLVLSSLIAIMLLSFLITNFIPFSIGLSFYAFSAINIYIALCQVWNIFEYKILLKDIKRNKLFLRNELRLAKRFKVGTDKHNININDIQRISTRKLNNLVSKVNRPRKRILKKIV